MRTGWWRRRAGVALILLLLGITLGAIPAQAELVINELLADPARDWDRDGGTDSTNDEWVEVYNPGPDPVMLTSYWLRDGLGDAPHLNLFGEILPGQVVVFYGSHALAWQEENGGGSSGLSLNNGGDTVQLLRTNDTNPDQLDIVDETTYISHTAEDDRAMGRMPDGGSWELFDGHNPYNGDLEPQGNGCLPTPGINNVCEDETPVTPVSWGEVKIRWE